jgi:hypothetical protein
MLDLLIPNISIASSAAAGSGRAVFATSVQWPPREWTRDYGFPGQVDELGRIQKINVVPKPYQRPHPPLFKASSISKETCALVCARGNYADHPALAAAARYVKKMLPVEEATTARRERADFAYMSSVDDVRRRMDAMVENAHPEWFAWQGDQGLLPTDVVKKQVETLRARSCSRVINRPPEALVCSSCARRSPTPSAGWRGLVGAIISVPARQSERDRRPARARFRPPVSRSRGCARRDRAGR